MSNASEKYAHDLKSDYEGCFDFLIGAGLTAHGDFTIPYVKWISGLQMILNGHSMGDQVWFQIIANIQHPTYGLLTDQIINEFGEGWYVQPDTQSQPILIPDNYMSKLDPNDPAIVANTLRIRVKYKNTGATEVRCLANVIFDKQ